MYYIYNKLDAGIRNIYIYIYIWLSGGPCPGPVIPSTDGSNLLAHEIAHIGHVLLVDQYLVVFVVDLDRLEPTNKTQTRKPNRKCKLKQQIENKTHETP